MTDISTFSLPGAFWRGSLHAHANHSEGDLQPDELVEAYKSADYDFMMLPEQSTGQLEPPIAVARAMRTNSFSIIVGAVLKAPHTAVGEPWHIIAAGLPLDFEPCSRGESGPALARRAADAGAFISIAHPTLSHLTAADGHSIDVAHAVEVYNHGCAVQSGRGDGWYLLDQMLNDGKRLTALATDGAYYQNHDDDTGGGWVNVKADSLEPAALLQALKLGHYYSSQGPQIHSLSISGDQLDIECSPVDRVFVVGGTSGSASYDGRSFTKATVDLSQLEGRIFKTDPSPWIRVTVVDEFGKRAWSNPIWRDEL